MSNETDLDWLARNVHVWQGAERCVSVCNGVIRWTVGYKPVDGLAWFTKSEWLASRAELHGVTEKFKPSIEEANRMAQEFKPFTSIEDNQELSVSQEHEMKQDNGWFERGELPPVGILCLYVVSDRLSAEVEITAHAKFGLCFVLVGTSGESYVSKTAELHRFRPIRTEREKQVDELESLLRMTSASTLDHLDVIAAAIYAAGFRKEKK